MAAGDVVLTYENGTVYTSAQEEGDAAVLSYSFSAVPSLTIGAGVTHKVGFWGATPVAQPASANQAALTDSTGGAVGDTTLNPVGSSAYGSLSISSSAATTIAVNGTYYKAAGTTAAGAVSEFTHSNNRLQYTGTAAILAAVNMSICATCAASTKILGFKLAKGGVVIDSTVVRRKIGTGSDVGACSVTGLVALAENEFVELWTTNEDSTDAVTVDNLSMNVVAIPQGGTMNDNAAKITELLNSVQSALVTTGLFKGSA